MRKKYISEVSDSSVASAAVGYNFELVSPYLLTGEKEERFLSSSPRTRSVTNHTALFQLGSWFGPGPFPGCSEPHCSIASIAAKRALLQYSAVLGNEKHCPPGQADRELNTSPSIVTEHRLRQTKESRDCRQRLGLRTIRPLTPRFCAAEGQQRRGREGAEDTGRQGTGKGNRDWAAKSYRPASPGTSILIGTLEGLCNCSACAGQHPDPTCTIRCHPARVPCRGTRPPAVTSIASSRPDCPGYCAAA